MVIMASGMVHGYLRTGDNDGAHPPNGQPRHTACRLTLLNFHIGEPCYELTAVKIGYLLANIT